MKTKFQNDLMQKEQKIGSLKTKFVKMRNELFQAKENTELQKEILEEIHTLKEDPPAWAQAENAEELREERDKLLVENAKFRSGVSAYPDGVSASEQVDQGVVRYLKMKLYHYE